MYFYAVFQIFYVNSIVGREVWRIFKMNGFYEVILFERVNLKKKNQIPPKNLKFKIYS